MLCLALTRLSRMLRSLLTDVLILGSLLSTSWFLYLCTYADNVQQLMFPWQYRATPILPNLNSLIAAATLSKCGQGFSDNLYLS